MGRQRTKGSIDFILENPEGYIECKRFTDRITYSLNSEQHDIKWSQIEFLHKKYLEGHLAGFIFQETYDKRLIFVHIRDFVIHWIKTSAKSMNVKQALIIGREITDFKFLNVDTSNDVEGGRNDTRTNIY